MEIAMGTALTFVYAHLEYFVAGLGAVGMIGFVKSKKFSNHSNDLTSMVVKQKKYNETVNKRSKGSM